MESRNETKFVESGKWKCGIEYRRTTVSEYLRMSMNDFKEHTWTIHLAAGQEQGEQLPRLPSFYPTVVELLERHHSLVADVLTSFCHSQSVEWEGFRAWIVPAAWLTIDLLPASPVIHFLASLEDMQNNSLTNTRNDILPDQISHLQR